MRALATAILTVCAIGFIFAAGCENLITLDPLIFGSNRAPTADAGPDLNRVVGEVVPLDGSASSDQDDDTLTFGWTFVDGPAPVDIADRNSSHATFVPATAGTYEFNLHVDDRRGGNDDAVVRVFITTATPGEDDEPSDDEPDDPPPIDDLEAKLSGDWTGFRENPASGETFEMAVVIEQPNLTFQGRVSTDSITEWRMAGEVVDPDELTDVERATWESAIGEEPQAGMLLIRFQPTTKITGHFVRGEFLAIVDGDEMRGSHLDGEYTKTFVLSR
ncbi:MAG TPA: PKD domain-containing protein [Phycisphaerae bacterium]|nr:PKD domain-containing protein [Phycisphaerae bacterium]